MGGGAEFDPSGIMDAARAMATDAGTPLMNAQAYMKDHTDIPWYAFGILPAIAARSYDDARQAQIDNMEQGVTKFKNMLDGLQEVAKGYHNGEVANTLKSEGVEAPEGGKSSVDDFAEGSVVLAAVGGQAAMQWGRVGWATVNDTLVAMYRGAEVTKAANSRLSVVVIVSSVIWALLQPLNENAVDKAGSAWKSAAEELAKVEDDKLKGMFESRLDPSAWGVSNQSRQAFTPWIEEFGRELGHARQAADAQEKALESLMDQVGNAQLVMLGVDVATLAALIFAVLGLQTNPFTLPAGKALEIAVSIANAVATAGMAAWVVSAVTQWVTIANKITQSVAFGNIETGESKKVDDVDVFDAGDWATLQR